MICAENNYNINYDKRDFFFSVSFNNSFKTKGIKDIKNTMDKSLKSKEYTLNIEDKNGTKIIISCRSIANIIEAIKYLFLKNPSLNIDFLVLLIFKEKKS